PDRAAPEHRASRTVRLDPTRGQRPTVRRRTGMGASASAGSTGVATMIDRRRDLTPDPSPPLVKRGGNVMARRGLVTWTYRLLWLLAILLVIAMPMVIVLRGDVWLGSASFDEASRPRHPLIVVDGDVTVRTSLDYPLVVLVGNVDVDGPLHDDLIVVGGNVLL